MFNIYRYIIKTQANQVFNFNDIFKEYSSPKLCGLQGLNVYDVVDVFNGKKKTNLADSFKETEVHYIMAERQKKCNDFYNGSQPIHCSVSIFR